jgi:hypothetical protein
VFVEQARQDLGDTITERKGSGVREVGKVADAQKN